MIATILPGAAHWVHFWDKHGEALVEALARILVILVGYVIIRFITFRLADRLIGAVLSRAMGDFPQARRARVGALRTMLRSVIGFVLSFLVIIMVLEAAGISIVSLVSVAGVVGLAVGFGAQKLVKDVISGFFILAEDQYGVGDYVTIGALTGQVEELGMRTTRIRDRGGKLSIISNGDISQVINHSRGKYLASFDFPVAPSADIAKAADLLSGLGKPNRRGYADSGDGAPYIPGSIGGFRHSHYFKAVGSGDSSIPGRCAPGAELARARGLRRERDSVWRVTLQVASE